MEVIFNELFSVYRILNTLSELNKSNVSSKIGEKIKFSIRLLQLREKYFPRDLTTENKSDDLLLDKFMTDKLGKEVWINLMSDYQLVKKYQQNTGNFWQEFFSLFVGWKNLGTGDRSGLDLCNENEKIYVELKNRYNTDNSSAKKKNIEKLKKKSDEGFTAIYGVVNENNSSGKYQEHSGYNYVSGNHLFKLICGSPEIVHKITDLLPLIHVS